MFNAFVNDIINSMENLAVAGSAASINNDDMEDEGHEQKNKEANLINQSCSKNEVNTFFYEVDSSNRFDIETSRRVESEVGQVNDEENPNRQALCMYSDTYRLEDFKTNLLVIFNHVRVSGYENRVGTEKDVEALTETFKNFSFQVLEKTDLTTKEILAELDTFANRDFSDYGCIAVAVLTHGQAGGKLAAKVPPPYSEDDIISRVSSKKNPTLVTKPKIVLIQACRGEEKFAAVHVGQKSGEPCQNNNDDETFYTVPVESDMLVIHSSYAGTKSIRTGNGSWLIQALCSKINSLAHKEDLESILVQVKRSVAIDKRYFKYDKNADVFMMIKQMPVTTSTLTRKLYLKKHEGDVPEISSDCHETWVTKLFKNKLQELVDWLTFTERTVKSLELVPTEELVIDVEKIGEHKWLHDVILSKKSEFDQLSKTSSCLIWAIEEETVTTLSNQLQDAIDRYNILVLDSISNHGLLSKTSEILRYLDISFKNLTTWMENMEELAKKLLPMMQMKDVVNEMAENIEEINSNEERLHKIQKTCLELMKYISEEETQRLKNKLDGLQQRYDLLTLPLICQLHSCHNRLIQWITIAEQYPFDSLYPNQNRSVSELVLLSTELQEFRSVLNKINSIGQQLCQLIGEEGAKHIEDIISRDNRRFNAISYQVQKKAEKLVLGEMANTARAGSEMFYFFPFTMTLLWVQETENVFREAELIINSSSELKQFLQLQNTVTLQKKNVDTLVNKWKKLQGYSWEERILIRKRGIELKNVLEKVIKQSTERMATLTVQFSDAQHDLLSPLNETEKPIELQELPALYNEQQQIRKESFQLFKKLEDMQCSIISFAEQLQIASLLSENPAKSQEYNSSTDPIKIIDITPELLSWLKKKQLEIDDDSPVYGDKDSILALIDRHWHFKEELRSHEKEIESILRIGNEQEPTISNNALQQCNELKCTWYNIIRLTQLKTQKLEHALEKVEDLECSFNKILEWLTDAKHKLNHSGQFPKNVKETEQQIRDDEMLLHELEENQKDIEQTVLYGHLIMNKDHTTAGSVEIKRTIDFIQRLSDEVYKTAMMRREILVAHVQYLKDCNSEEIFQSVLKLENLLFSLNKEMLPDSIEELTALIDKHESLIKDMRFKQDEIIDVCEIFQFENQSQSHESTISTSHSTRSAFGPYPATVYRSPLAKQLWTKWLIVWDHASERQKRLNDHLIYLKEQQSLYSWDDWKKRFVKYMRIKKSHLMVQFCKMDKLHGNNELISRKEFIDRITNTEFDTSRQELEATADKFKKNIRGLINNINWTEFIAALRLDVMVQRQLKHGNKDTHALDEVKRLVNMCTCNPKFKMVHAGEDKYRFGDSKILRLVRIVRSNVMVRVGGGWLVLSEFLDKNDPCRTKGRTQQKHTPVDEMSQNVPPRQLKTTSSETTLHSTKITSAEQKNYLSMTVKSDDLPAEQMSIRELQDQVINMLSRVSQLTSDDTASSFQSSHRRSSMQRPSHEGSVPSSRNQLWVDPPISSAVEVHTNDFDLSHLTDMMSNMEALQPPTPRSKSNASSVNSLTMDRRGPSMPKSDNNVGRASNTSLDGAARASQSDSEITSAFHPRFTRRSSVHRSRSASPIRQGSRSWLNARSTPASRHSSGSWMDTPYLDLSVQSTQQRTDMELWGPFSAPAESSNKPVFHLHQPVTPRSNTSAPWYTSTTYDSSYTRFSTYNSSAVLDSKEKEHTGLSTLSIGTSDSQSDYEVFYGQQMQVRKEVRRSASTSSSRYESRSGSYGGSMPTSRHGSGSFMNPPTDMVRKRSDVDLRGLGGSISMTPVTKRYYPSNPRSYSRLSRSNSYTMIKDSSGLSTSRPSFTVGSSESQSDSSITAAARGLKNRMQGSTSSSRQNFRQDDTSMPSRHEINSIRDLLLDVKKKLDAVTYGVPTTGFTSSMDVLTRDSQRQTAASGTSATTSSRQQAGGNVSRSLSQSYEWTNTI